MGENMLMTIGGIILLSTFVLYANGLIFDNTKISSDNEYAITAISLAQSVIDEAKMKAFDESTIAGPVASADSLTPASMLGRDGTAEAVANPDTPTHSGAASFAKFDDIDDYDGYVRVVNTPRAENYSVATTVVYASETSPNSTSSTRTFCKRMTVTVTSPYISVPITLSYVFTH